MSQLIFLYHKSKEFEKKLASAQQKESSKTVSYINVIKTSQDKPKVSLSNLQLSQTLAEAETESSEVGQSFEEVHQQRQPDSDYD